MCSQGETPVQTLNYKLRRTSQPTNQYHYRVNIELWKTDSPALQVPEAILIQTLEKGTEGLVMRRKEEYHLWQNSKSI